METITSGLLLEALFVALVGDVTRILGDGTIRMQLELLVDMCPLGTPNFARRVANLALRMAFAKDGGVFGHLGLLFNFEWGSWSGR